MWTLSGFADEISPTSTEQCQVASDLGLTYVEFRSAWDTNVLDLTDEQLERRAETPGRPRPVGLLHRLTDRQDQHRRRLRRRTWSAMSRARTWRASSRRPVHPASSRSSSAPARRRRTTATRCIEPDERPRRVRRGRRRRAAAREREGHLRRRPEPLPRHRRVGRLAAPAAGLGPRQLRAGRRPPVHRRLRRCCARTWSTSRSRTRCRRPATVVPAGEGDGEVRETIRALRPTASTASSRWSRTWATTSSSGAFSGPELFARPTPPSPTFFAAKGSSTHERARQHRFALVGAGVIGDARTGGPQPSWRTAELVAVVDVATRPGREARRRARRQARSPRSTEALREADVDVVVGLHPHRPARRGRDRGARRRQARRSSRSRSRRPSPKADEIIEAQQKAGQRRRRSSPSTASTAATETVARRRPATGTLGPADLRHRVDRLVARAELLRLRRLARHLGARRRRRADEPGGAHRRPAHRRRWAGPVEVFAYTGVLAHERIEVEDVAVAVVRFESGALGRPARHDGRLPRALPPGCRSTGTGARPSSTTTSWSSSTEPRPGRIRRSGVWGRRPSGRGRTQGRRPPATRPASGTRTGCST